MVRVAASITLLCILKFVSGAEIRLLDLEPTDAQQYIDKQDTTLKYAPKVDSNVPAVRFLGNEPHNVLEDIYLANQYHGQDGLGGYLYGYAVPDIAKTERKQAGGDLRGAYNYIAGNGQEIKVEYWDNGNGFHQTDNVPKILPKQIPDTPEVQAAKDEHLRLWHEQAERNSKPIASPFNSEGQYAEGPLSLQGQKLTQNQQAQQQYQQPQQQYQQPQQQYQQPQQQYQQPQQQYQQPQQQYQQPQQQYQQLQQPQQQPQQPQPQQPQQGQYSPQHPQPEYLQQQYQKPQQQLQQGQYSPQASSLVNQYQQQKQQFPNPGQSVQYQGGQTQQTQTSSQYQKYDQNLKSDGEDDGQYRAQEGEETGPPKGFFYNFDYPVGIIVQKEGVQKRSDDVKDVYATNKAIFEKQLQGNGQDARSARSSSGYLYVKN